MVSRRLLADWHARLIALQDPVDPRNVHNSWLRRIYLRVLTYLVNCYGSDVDAAPLVSPFDPRKVSSSAGEPTAPESVSANASNMPLYVATAVGEGRPPRDAATIRSVLDAVQREVPPADAGPLAEGLSPHDTIVVASFYKSSEAEHLQAILQSETVESTVQALGKRFAVYVHVADLDRARPLVARHGAYSRDSVRHRRSYEAKWTSIGTFSGAALGAMAAVILLFLDPLMAAEWGFKLGAILFLALLGSIVGGFVGYIVGQIANESD